MPLIPFSRFDDSDGELWLLPEAVVRVEKAPNRRSASRIFFWADGRELYADLKATPTEVADRVNAALQAVPEP